MGLIPRDEAFMAALVCWACGYFNQAGSLYCYRCGNLLYRVCSYCGTQVQANLGACPRCGYLLPPPNPATTIQQTPYQADPTLRPTGSILDINLITRLLIKRRTPIYQPSPVVYERLDLYTINRSSTYLTIGLVAFLIGLATASAVVASQGLAALLPAAVITALIPAAAYLLWMYANDRFEREHIWLIMLAFGWGCFSMIPAALLNDLISVGWSGRAAFTEEPLKILGVYLIATNQRLKSEYNDHLDGLVYGVAAGLGFAFAENILYIARNLETIGPIIILIRIFSMTMHMFATGMIGYWIGYLKIYGMPVRLTTILPALVLAILVHMIWNTLAQFLNIAGLVIVSIWAGFMVYYLNKLAREALIDEYYWGFAHGYTPRE